MFLSFCFGRLNFDTLGLGFGLGSGQYINTNQNIHHYLATYQVFKRTEQNRTFFICQVFYIRVTIKINTLTDLCGHK